MRRRAFIALVTGTVAAKSVVVRAQQTSRVARVGFLGPTSASSVARRLDGLRSGLAELGWVEGRGLVIEYRWADGRYERLPELAGELVRTKVDVLVVQSTPGILAAKQATSTIPIVMASATDAVATGLVESLARPGGNVTGLTFFGPELYVKRVELLKQAVPRLARAAMVFNPQNTSFRVWLQEVDEAARAMKVELTRVELRTPDELDNTFDGLVRRRVQAFAITDDALFNANPGRIADQAMKRRLLSAGNREYAEAGGMIGYGHDAVALYRRAAYFVDKILKGVRPADLPVERPTKFELIVNLKSAGVARISIPPAVIGRADEMIR